RVSRRSNRLHPDLRSPDTRRFPLFVRQHLQWIRSLPGIHGPPKVTRTRAVVQELRAGLLPVLSYAGLAGAPLKANLAPAGAGPTDRRPQPWVLQSLRRQRSMVKAQLKRAVPVARELTLAAVNFPAEGW